MLLAFSGAYLPQPVLGQCATEPQLLLPFRAFDAQTGQEVQAFCMGRPVRFELSPGRVVNTDIPTFFVVQPGVNALPPGCNFNLPGQPTNLYTPTAAGPVTVSENSNVGSGATARSVVYFRNFTVFPTPPPTFNLAPCANNTALITITDTNYDSYGLRVAGTGPAEIALSRGQTATVPAGTGSFTLLGRYTQNGLCEGSATQTLAPLAAPVAPVFSGLTLAGLLPGPATLEVSQLTPGYFYTVQLADASVPGGYRDIGPVPANGSFPLLNAPPGCYRLRRRDACGTAEAFTADICTLELEASAGNGRNLLTFGTSTTGALRYELRRTAGTSAAQLLRTFPTLPATFEDAEVVCGTRYTYRLTAVLTEARQSISNEVSLSAQSTLAPPTPLLAASFDLRNRVSLTATLPGGQPVPASSQLVFSRSLGGQAPQVLGQPTSAAALRDSTQLSTLLAQPPCYLVRLADQCGNAAATASNAACPALLRAEAVPASPDPAVRLSWTTPTGPDPAQPPRYRLLLLNAAGNELRAVPVSGNSYLDQTLPPEGQTLRYRLEVSGLGLSAPTFSNLAAVVRPVRIAVPNAFTPNGDGLNDVLEIKGRFLRSFLFTVFDRNGQEVFRATDRAQTWDGRIGGRAPVNGAYVWRLSLSDEAGQLVQQTGTVTILK
ncbi:gliding motility-associated C-terminal domain-containing protein [uncultured Hymenobacter sp.]|uniref:T9SS type B sorting domain-containing protein n=1 Tax=uncultured Hymenobacter sp. TaxID=170016 RepID=UPI0035C94F15